MSFREGLFINNKKTVTISSLICLLPIIVGSILWAFLPDRLYAMVGMGPNISKEIMIFLIPILFFLLHLIVVFKSDWLNIPKSKKRHWYIPTISSITFLGSFIWSFLKG